MNITQLSLSVAQRTAEDSKHIRETVNTLKSEGYTKERLQKAYKNCLTYDRDFKGSRGNTILMKAIEVLLPHSLRPTT
jgi:Holliday junction resolvasome RuvABC DNA-binding subunit